MPTNEELSATYESVMASTDDPPERIKLTRAEINEIARAVVLANTPASLFHQLRGLPAVAKLMECSNDALMRYYRDMTARARRTENVLGIAYCVLIAGLLKGALIDPTRLQWGPVFEDLLQKNTVVTNISSMPSAVSKLPQSGSAYAGVNMPGAGLITLTSR